MTALQDHMRQRWVVMDGRSSAYIKGKDHSSEIIKQSSRKRVLRREFPHPS